MSTPRDLALPAEKKYTNVMNAWKMSDESGLLTQISQKDAYWKNSSIVLFLNQYHNSSEWKTAATPLQLQRYRNG